MAEYMNMDTLRFQLQQVHQLESLFQYPRYREYDLDAINIFLDAVKDFSDQELYPVFREMDEKPPYNKDGKTIAHPAVGKAMKKMGELGVIPATFSHEDGGLQMPGMALLAAYFIMESANNHIPGYSGLTDGAAKLVATFGSDFLKETYVPNMLSGRWAGTMCLTEPQAGSSLSDITAAAYPTGEEYYKIKGQKIFISGGDHEHNENFIHLLLARIEGAPAGTRGISLFVVPKKRISGDGALVPNDVITAGDFQKLGQRGYCTTHLVFGENDDCRAWLVGQPNEGLKYMFQMMNDARISVGRGGLSIASAAYHASLQYARERPQGRRVMDSGKKDPGQEPVLIIQHADVRRMLLLQKAIYEGSLCLLLLASKYHDLELATEGEEKEKNKLLLELLTPVAKTYPTEKGKEAVDNGLQVLGGYGFCSDFVLQQYYRDIRIMAIYEGTTGIQSLDLLGRKVTAGNGRAVQLLAAEMQQTISQAMAFDELKPYARQLGEKMQLSQKVLGFLLPFAAKGEYERFLSDATVFMEFFGTLVVGWLWLKMAVVAKQELAVGNTGFTAEFYESKLHTMKFYFKYELPRMEGLAPTLMSEEVLTILEEKEVIA